MESLESHGDLGNRRMLFRLLAKDQPGKLSLQTIRDFRVRLEAGDVDIPEDELCPVFLKYLMQVYSVHWPANKIGSANHRELRTYAEACDGLMRGNLNQVLDLLSQAFKAKMMAIEDGNWDTARWLQLLPECDGVTSIPESDKEMARRIQASKLREEERAHKVGSRTSTE